MKIDSMLLQLSPHAFESPYITADGAWGKRACRQRHIDTVAILTIEPQKYNSFTRNAKPLGAHFRVFPESTRSEHRRFGINAHEIAAAFCVDTPNSLVVENDVHGRRL